MFGKLITLVALSGAAVASLTIWPTQAKEMRLTNLRATYDTVGAPTLVPYGWYDLCRRYTGECDTKPLPAVDVNLTPSSYKELVRIDHWVNKEVKPLSAMDHWGVINKWDYPVDGYGDCNSYALLKRKLLMEDGFPRQALLLTVVLDTHGDGHNILTVKTNRGEFVLDNLTNAIKPWNETGYWFVKRQSQTDPNVWVSIGEPVS